VHEPSDAAMWRAVEATVRDVLLPSLADDWARVVAVQLVGMARFATTRPADPTPARVAELATVLDRLRDNPVVAPHWPVPATSPEGSRATTTLATRCGPSCGRSSAATSTTTWP
jgi:hypothetical protein